MIKPGQLVRIGSHIGLVIKSLSPSYTNGFTSVDWWYVLIEEEMVPCHASSLEVMSDAR